MSEPTKKKNPAAVALGRMGGKANVSKGFSNPDVMRKALETRRLRAAKKKNENSVDT